MGDLYALFVCTKYKEIFSFYSIFRLNNRGRKRTKTVSLQPRLVNWFDQLQRKSFIKYWIKTVFIWLQFCKQPNKEGDWYACRSNFPLLLDKSKAFSSPVALSWMMLVEKREREKKVSLSLFQLINRYIQSETLFSICCCYSWNRRTIWWTWSRWKSANIKGGQVMCLIYEEMLLFY